MEIPKRLTAGDLWTWTDALADYLAPTWVLSYHFTGPQPFSAVGTASGTSHLFSVAATATKDRPHGAYPWIARVVNGSTSSTIARGTVTVQPNLENLAADNRSFWKIQLDTLEAVMKNRATTDQMSYSIAGRSVSRMSPAELREEYAIAWRQVAIENGKDPSRMLVSFA